MNYTFILYTHIKALDCCNCHYIQPNVDREHEMGGLSH